MMNQNMDDIIINFLLRKASAEDVQTLKKWLDADSAHRNELKQWLKTWDIADMADDAGRYRLEEACQRFIFRLRQETSLESTLKKSRTKIILMNIRRIAAIFIIGFSSGLLTYFYLSQSRPAETALVENIVPLGSKSEIKLPDGSTVWLNAGSKLCYPADYGKATRDVYLEGEGYFKVARQVKKPFVVHTAMMNIKALGTEFNVRAYQDEKVAETMLVSGKVVIDKRTAVGLVNRPVILKPGQKFSIATTSAQTKTDKPVPVAEADSQSLPAPVIKQLSPAVVDAEVSWKELNWRIEREELQSLAVKLERRYDVKIKVDDRLKTYRFSGTLKDESLEQVLTAMQLSSPIWFLVKGKEVAIYVDEKKMKQ
jgi:ferric-dicitrate binding protein FerR (iron transport regulator)